jgi:hypothetical protein
LWPFLKGILACGGRQCASIVPPLGAACGFGVSFATCDLRQRGKLETRTPKFLSTRSGYLRRNLAFTFGRMHIRKLYDTTTLFTLLTLWHVGLIVDISVRFEM